MASSTASELMDLLDQLKTERAEYVAKIEEIDATFERLGAAIPGSTPEAASPGPGRPKGTSGRKRQRFEKTGEQSVLDYIVENPGAASADINEHWSGEGRGGRADNTLTKLVKNGKIKRTPIPGQARGGTYTAV